MVKNCFPADLLSLCKREKTTQSAIADELGLVRASINRRANGNVISKGYVEIVEMLGYDIEVNYIKRSEQE